LDGEELSIGACTLKRFILPGILLSAALLTFAGLHEFTPPPQKHCGRMPKAAQNNIVSRARFSLDENYTSSDSVHIPDYPGDTAVSVINVRDDVLITDLNVFVDIRHTWMRDLRVSLTFDTIEVLLMDMLPLDSAVNLSGTFDDEAGVSILSADTPLIGYWQPIQLLDRFDGLYSAGDWTLRVYDRFRLDSGYVASWGLSVNPVINLSGTVRNSLTQAPVRSAVVWANEAGQAVRTNSSGLFEFTGLNSGTYTVLFTKTDYETLTVAGVEISATDPLDLDTVMQTLPGRFEFASTQRSVAIPPDSGGSAAMMLTVNENIIITDLDVTVNVVHTWMSDLDLYLINPQSDTVHLAPHGTGDSLNGYVDCRFDDEAGISITSGSYPFTGRYRPAGSLATFDGDSTAGVWQLLAVDRAPGDSGTILNFTLHVQGEPAFIGNQGDPAPRSFEFYGCYPNPFNARTEFRFNLTRPGRAQLIVFDLLGREVKTAADRWFDTGEQRVSFNAAGMPSGLYVARLSLGDVSQVRKLVLMK
jgi:subtilisin-like proprotein convertase family protein